MIGIGPILIVLAVIAIIGSYVAVIHHALKSTEVSVSEVPSTANCCLDNPTRGNSGKPKPAGAFAPIKA